MNLFKACFSRNNSYTSMYNFNLEELIGNFSFYDFISNQPKKEIFDYGAFAVFTDNQYVIGYNSGYGIGTHYSSFARFMKNIHGGGNIGSTEEAYKLSDKCQMNYITVKINYEEISNVWDVESKRTGGIRITMPFRGISLNQYNLFKKFYDEYNEDIKYAIKKSNGTFDVSYQGTKVGIVGKLDSLDEVLKFIEEHVDYSVIPEENDEIIIGTGIGKTRKLK